MRDALEIFRKDVRHLWPQIGGFLLLTGIHGYLDATHKMIGLALPVMLLLIAAWFLIVSAIHAERLAGDRQYWLTRPISWRSLLPAKALFALAFLNVPVLVSQMTGLAVNGVPPLAHLPELIGIQARLTAFVVLPAAVLAAVTGGLVEFVLTSLGLVAAFYFAGAFLGDHLYEYSSSWGAMERVRAPVETALTLTVLGVAIGLQYRLRRTWAARSVLACAVLFGILSQAIPAWHAAFALGRTETGVLLEFDSARRPLGRASRQLEAAPGEVAVAFMIPVRVEGIPAGRQVLSERILASVEAANGERWNSGWRSIGGLVPVNEKGEPVLVIVSDGAYWERINIDRDFFDRIKRSPVRLRTTVALTLLAEATVTQLPPAARAWPTPGAGFCSVTPHYVSFGGKPYTAAFVWCYAAFRSAYWVTTNLIGNRPSDEAQSLFAASGSMPFSVWQSSADAGTVPPGGIEIQAREAAAHFDRELTLDNLRLDDYEVARSGGVR